MAYVKGKGYQATGYTTCQKELAEWINLGHTCIRDDAVLRDYACKGQSSRWYTFVKSEGIDNCNGAVTLIGAGVPGKDFTTSDGRVIKGKVIDKTFTSSQFGLKITVKGWGLTGRQVLQGFF